MVFGVILATVGVLITAVITGAAAYYFLGVPVIVAWLLGATLSARIMRNTLIALPLRNGYAIYPRLYSRSCLAFAGYVAPVIRH